MAVPPVRTRHHLAAAVADAIGHLVLMWSQTVSLVCTLPPMRRPPPPPRRETQGRPFPFGTEWSWDTSICAFIFFGGGG